jgi:transcription elongation factor Elf1
LNKVLGCPILLSLIMTMPKRANKVTRWLSSTPAVAVCTSCRQQFKVPMTALSRTIDAQNNLQEQFDRHKCTQEDAN